VVVTPTTCDDVRRQQHRDDGQHANTTTAHTLHIPRRKQAREAPDRGQRQRLRPQARGQGLTDIVAMRSIVDRHRADDHVEDGR
jgi:hypothetical protein